MANVKKSRAFTRMTQQALLLFGTLIRVERKQKKWSEAELAERAGISRATLQKIEKGDPSVAIGLFFEVASLVGVALFEADNPKDIKQLQREQEKLLKLLPKNIHKPKKEFDDAF